MKKSLISRLLIPIGSAVVLTIGIWGYLFSTMLENEITENVNAQVNSVTQRTVSMMEIVATSQRAADMVQSMSTVTQEQSMVLERINNSIRSISAVTAETVSSTEQVALAAEQMNEMTEQPNRLLERFNLESQAERSHRSKQRSEGRHGRESPSVRSKHGEPVIA